MAALTRTCSDIVVLATCAHERVRSARGWAQHTEQRCVLRELPLPEKPAVLLVLRVQRHHSAVVRVFALVCTLSFMWGVHITRFCVSFRSMLWPAASRWMDMTSGYCAAYLGENRACCPYPGLASGICCPSGYEDSCGVNCLSENQQEPACATSFEPSDTACPVSADNYVCTLPPDNRTASQCCNVEDVCNFGPSDVNSVCCSGSSTCGSNCLDPSAGTVCALEADPSDTACPTSGSAHQCTNPPASSGLQSQCCAFEHVCQGASGSTSICCGDGMVCGQDCVTGAPVCRLPSTDPSPSSCPNNSTEVCTAYSWDTANQTSVAVGDCCSEAHTCNYFPSPYELEQLCCDSPQPSHCHIDCFTGAPVCMVNFTDNSASPTSCPYSLYGQDMSCVGNECCESAHTCKNDGSKLDGKCCNATQLCGHDCCEFPVP